MALEEILMPKLGESVNEGTITTWLVKEGDHVNEYDPIAEVMTDKVNAEIPSSYTGTIKEIVVEEGVTVQIDELICYIDVANGNKRTETESTTKAQQEKNVENKDEAAATNMKARFSPAVARLAAEHDIDLQHVIGTGHGGRITRKDMHAFIEQMQSTTSVPAPKPAVEKAASSQTQNTAVSYDKAYALTGVRKAIADKMVLSKQEIPHAWMTDEVDVTDLVTYRNKVKDDFKAREGYNLTYFSFFMYAVAQGLKEYPMLNSTWEQDKLINHRDINLSIAVAKEEELFVPVVKQVDEKSITGIAKSIGTLANKARSNQLTQDDMAGGTFTVNNTGTFGSVSSMGIINYPQVAILQVESIVKRPVIINDMFAARDIVNLSLSLDHRVLDGLICGRFLAKVKHILENMNEATLSI